MSKKSILDQSLFKFDSLPSICLQLAGGDCLLFYVSEFDDFHESHFSEFHTKEALNVRLNIQELAW